jgi:hypothetical protein
VRTQGCVINKIANERELLSQPTGLVSVELRLAVDLKRWKQVELIGAGEMLDTRKQTLWDLPSAPVRSESDRLIAGVTFGFEAIREVAFHGIHVLRLTPTLSGRGEQREPRSAEA